jgi:soluble lytic murein transglycosylase
MRFTLSFLLLFGSSLAAATTDFSAKLAHIDAQSLTEVQLLEWQQELLFPHYYEHWLTKNIATLDADQVELFSRNPDNHAANWFFQPKWRAELVRRQDWTTINREFAQQSDPYRICYYFASRQALDQPLDKAAIERLWLSGRSRPNHCDPFFKLWLDGLADPTALIWQRQLAAFYARNGGLLRYLNQFYTNKAAQQLGQFLIRVYDDPTDMLSQSYDPASERMRGLALAAVNRLAYQDPRSASNLWLQIVKASPDIDLADIRTASRYLGIAMAKQALPEAAYWLAIADPAKDDELVQHWRLQIALSQDDYPAVIDYYQDLSAQLQKSDQWLYWYGLARYKTEGRLAADNSLIRLSGQRLYYGYLAAGVLGTEPSLNADPQYPARNLSELAQQPELRRAKALFLAGETKRAQVEWNLWVRQQDNGVQHSAAELALSWGWYAKASQSAGWSGRYDLIHLRYPDAYGAFIEDQAERLNLPSFWLYGVMRQESRFQQTVISPAGAYGLMQLMPRTAQQVASKHLVPYRGQTDLYQPSTNIALGSHYLSDLIKKFDHPVYATAAYNAGPSRVIQWRERFPSEMTIWIESIPFDETRGYVKAVLAYSQIYALTTGSEWRMSAWTTPTSGFVKNIPVSLVPQ